MARYGVLLLVLLAATATPAAAQDRLTLFLHGFNSTADTWSHTASRLGLRLQIVQYVPQLPWHLPYDTQATHLNNEANAAGAPANTIVVGHSNGGLVARQLSTKRALGGIVTVGSPHLGAPLAGNVQGARQFYVGAGEKLGVLLFMLGANGTNRYSGIYNSPAMAPLRLTLATLGSALTAAVGLIDARIAPVLSTPVLADMTPRSAALTALNSAGNLAREAAAVPRRVGLVYAAREWWVGAPFVGAAPQYQYSGDRAVKNGVQVLGLIEAYFTYPNVAPWDAAASTLRQQARSLINDLALFNATWCGATTGDFSCSISTDGIVPTESQYFPGSATNIGRYGAPHVWQTAESEDALVHALVTHLGVRTRDGGTTGTPAPGPPASTLTAGERLYPDTEIRSPNGAYVLRYQSDGNLVLYGPGGAVWSSGTAGAGGLFAEMQPDGNFVVYHANGADPWESGTAGIPGAELRVQDDGYLVVYDSGGNVPWYAPR